MANNDKNNIDEIHISVEPGTRTADLIERLEKDERLSKVKTPGDIKKLVKFYVGQTIQSVNEDVEKHILRPEKVNVVDSSMYSTVRSYQKGECDAEEFVELLMANMKLELLKRRTDNKGGAGGCGFGLNPMMGGMNPMMGRIPNSPLEAIITANLMSGESADILDKLMIIKLLSETLESKTAGIELECAHKITNCVLDSISEIALSKKTEPSKEEK